MNSPECTVTQFECSCGSIRCVDGETLKDGKQDCEDGSDEKGPSKEKLCPDGSAVRQNRAKNRTVAFPTYNAIAQCSDSTICRENLGEMCIVSYLLGMLAMLHRNCTHYITPFERQKWRC